MYTLNYADSPKDVLFGVTMTKNIGSGYHKPIKPQKVGDFRPKKKKKLNNKSVQHEI